MIWLTSHSLLESKSGVSDLLYLQLDKIARLSNEEEELSLFGGRGPHPRLDPEYLWVFAHRFQWTDPDEEDVHERSKREQEFWLETGLEGTQDRPESSLTRRFTSAAVPEEGSDYVPSSVPEERELRIRA